MRIISGEWRGRTIQAPDGGRVTRPTSDRVREALFSILMPHIAGARVLDLFAGSGALSMEALSRGAKSALLCDCDGRAIRTIERNIESLKAGDRASVLRAEASRAIECLASKGERFDLIFLDPPYRAGLMDQTLVAIAEHRLLEEEGVLVAESAAQNPPGAVPGLIRREPRRYGIALLTLYTPQVLP